MHTRFREKYPRANVTKGLSLVSGSNLRLLSQITGTFLLSPWAQTLWISQKVCLFSPGPTQLAEMVCCLPLVGSLQYRTLTNCMYYVLVSSPCKTTCRDRTYTVLKATLKPKEINKSSLFNCLKPLQLAKSEMPQVHTLMFPLSSVRLFKMSFLIV